MEDHEELEEQTRQFRKLVSQMKTTLIRFQPLENLSLGEYTLLKTVAELSIEKDSFLTSTEISKALGMSRPATSRMINGIEDKGYLERFMEERDRRVICVKLTQKGINVLENEKKIYQSAVRRIVKRMGQEDINKMLDMNDKLLKAIQFEINMEKKL